MKTTSFLPASFHLLGVPGEDIAGFPTARSGSLQQTIVLTPNKRAGDSLPDQLCPTTSYPRRCKPSTENRPRLTAAQSEHCLGASHCMADQRAVRSIRACHTERIAPMDEDRISSTARNVGGKIERGRGSPGRRRQKADTGKARPGAAGPPRTSTPRRLTPRATLPPLLTSGFAGLSKPSPIRWR